MFSFWPSVTKFCDQDDLGKPQNIALRADSVAGFVDVTASEICTLLHIAGLLPTTTTMDNSASGTCSTNGLIAAPAVV